MWLHIKLTGSHRLQDLLRLFLCVWIMVLSLSGYCFGDKNAKEAVILLHGLARSEKSMAKLGKSLTSAGYDVLNVAYPSREKTVEKIAKDYIPTAIETCRKNGATRIHFVTHSMGGIVVRYYFKYHKVPDLGRVVMLSPPNKGSEIVDRFKNNFIFKWLNGPAGQQLGTDKNSLPQQLGAVNFELGVIAGDESINWILSLFIPKEDDGKVSIENTKVEGMKDFIVVGATHPLIMKHKDAISQTIYFLKHGKFKKEMENER